MMRPTTLLIISSLLVGCGITRPDTTLYIVNVPNHKLSGYNLHDDYDDNGDLLPGAKPRVKELGSLDDVNKWVATDPDGLANLKAYIKKLREAYQHKAACE